MNVIVLLQHYQNRPRISLSCLIIPLKIENWIYDTTLPGDPEPLVSGAACWSAKRWLSSDFDVSVFSVYEMTKPNVFSHESSIYGVLNCSKRSCPPHTHSCSCRVSCRILHVLHVHIPCTPVHHVRNYSRLNKSNLKDHYGDTAKEQRPDIIAEINVFSVSDEMLWVMGRLDIVR